MNGLYLYEALGGIGPDLILEAERKQFPKNSWRLFAELAACVAVIVGLSLFAIDLLIAPPSWIAGPSMQHSMQTVISEQVPPGLPMCILAIGLLGAASIAPLLPVLFRKGAEEKKRGTVWSLFLCTLGFFCQMTGFWQQVMGDMGGLYVWDWSRHHYKIAAAALVAIVLINGLLWYKSRKHAGSYLLLAIIGIWIGCKAVGELPISAVLGLAGVGFGIASYKARRWTVVSLLGCGMALAFQVLYLRVAFMTVDHYELQTRGPAFLRMGIFLMALTLAVNGIGWLVRKRRRAANL